MTRSTLTEVEAAKYLGISRSTLRRLASKGKVPKLYLSERVPRYRIQDLDAYLESLAKKARSHEVETA